MTRLLQLIGCALFLAGAATGLARAESRSAEETWSNVSLIDIGCSTKAKAQPDGHTKACALQCAKGGFVIVAADGTFLKLDEEGNKKAVAALNASSKTDHLRVTVVGERKGDTVTVSSLRMAD